MEEKNKSSFEIKKDFYKKSMIQTPSEGDITINNRCIEDFETPELENLDDIPKKYYCKPKNNEKRNFGDSFNYCVDKCVNKYFSEDYMRKMKLRGKKYSWKTMDRCLGFVWGLCEGLSSGCLVAVNVTGSGGWICGMVGQLFGAILGPIGGALSGSILGLMCGRDAVRDLFAHYREYLGTRGFGKDGTMII